MQDRESELKEKNMTARPRACPCGSKLAYQDCCQILHKGGIAPGALSLMRSRYSAYALGLADYIMATTHPNNPSYESSERDWRKKILAFSRTTSFVRLEILDVQEGAQRGSVTFIAHLLQGGEDVSFQELSTFEKVDGRWLYLQGAKTLH